MKDRLIDLFGDGEPIDIELGPNGELPPGWEVVPPDPSKAHQTFREFMAENGKDFPDPNDPPAVWAAWFADARE